MNNNANNGQGMLLGGFIAVIAIFVMFLLRAVLFESIRLCRWAWRRYCTQAGRDAAAQKAENKKRAAAEKRRQKALRKEEKREQKLRNMSDRQSDRLRSRRLKRERKQLAKDVKNMNR